MPPPSGPGPVGALPGHRHISSDEFRLTGKQATFALGTWRVLRAHFPGTIETHSLVQDFFFDRDFRLRRHDYWVNIAGGFAASQLTSDYIVADGIHLRTKRRAYTRGPGRRPILDMLMVSIDISEVSFA